MTAAQPTNITRPAYLQKGDSIAIVAPAGIIKNHTSIHKAVKLAESWGLSVLLGAHVFDKHFHFAGSDANRLKDLQWALDHPSIKAIWCARGGYGSIRIIDDLNFDLFKKHPKWIIGYSDIGVLHNHIHHLNIETLHAMMPVNMELPEKDRKESVASLKKALFGQHIQYDIPSSIFNKTGVAKGRLIGGNLTILENLLGTDSSVNPKNRILFIEEIGEYKYHIDRMFRALKRNGHFDHCKGLIIGGMSQIKENNPVFGQSIEQIVLKIVKEHLFPVVFNFPAGHDDENRALFMGREVELSVQKNNTVLRFLD